MTYFYVYLDPITKGYEIFQTRESNKLGTYDETTNGQVYYFAGFTRSIDASNYVRRENNAR